MPSSKIHRSSLAGATRNDHEAWAAVKATPFLPGPSVNTLILQPARSSRSRQGLETDHRKRSGWRADDVAHRNGCHPAIQLRGPPGHEHDIHAASAIHGPL